MAIGGTIAYFLNWKGVFGIYALFALVPVILLLINYKSLPSERHPDAKLFAPYIKLLSNSKSLFTYFLVSLEGMFIVGGFSYAGSYVAEIYKFNYFNIGLIMTGFGIMTVIGGRLSGKVSRKMGARNILSLGLSFAAAGEIIIYFFGHTLSLLIIGVGFLGLGFIFTHSTLLTRATGFADKNRGAVMSLVAFCFMGGGGIGTAIGGKLINIYGLENLYAIYGSALVITLMISFILITP